MNLVTHQLENFIKLKELLRKHSSVTTSKKCQRLK